MIDGTPDTMREYPCRRQDNQYSVKTLGETV